MSQYPVPPPSYSDEETPLVDISETEPLIDNNTAGRIFDQPEADDVPDDFKYGTTVSDSAPEIRKAFIRKVYTILLSQILATVVVAGSLSQSAPALDWVMHHIWAFFVPLGGTIVNLGLLYWKRHTHPWNFVLLSTFTLMEAFTLGIAVAFYDNMVVLQALLITLAVFIGLTLFTFQSKYDFSGMGPFLFAALIVLCMTSIVHWVVVPFSKTTDIVFTVAGCLVFSGCVVYDTYRINKKLSPDEYIMGAISLYLDFLNLFLRILRLR
ncbi:glutamate binding protein [Mycena sp. CBHHK59/15]|nr:glutamate binding protein [Mycena sp. CBHHK59/15]KAJ6624164.1 glutamate binding protein [Mycena sp. CBHHK59/15]